MHSDLELLIKHAQSEVDHLTALMEQCIAERDFQGAHEYSKPLRNSERKLFTLKCLQNPNYEKIFEVNKRISRLKQNLGNNQLGLQYTDEKIRQQLAKHFDDASKRLIEKAREELGRLHAVAVVSRDESDNILGLLDLMAHSKITRVQLEIVPDRVYLTLKHEKEDLILRFDASSIANLDSYLTRHAKRRLIKLGFNDNGFVKRITDFRSCDPLRILESISIVYFDVFGIFGTEIQIVAD